MDDGTPIRLRVQINEEEVSVGVNASEGLSDIFKPPSPQGSAVFDFSGTGREVWGNCNAPRAITLSALIYCLRCMVGQDIPLNQVMLVKED